jgi:periplasmic copper chaperone A
MTRSTLAVATAAAVLAVPAAASAHVTLNPRAVEPGSFARMDVRVPNERDNKGTIKVAVRFPDGFFSLSYKKVPGWKARVVREQLDEPVDLGEFQADEQIKRVVWTGNKRKGGIIRPGQFEEFPISVRVPDGDAGDFLVFPAVQTYRGGEEVHWTGGPDSDEPAPRVELVPPAAAALAGR